MKHLGLVVLLIASSAVAADQVRPWYGMSVMPLHDERGREFLHVAAVAPGGPAERAGIRAGDAIFTISDVPVDFGDDSSCCSGCRSRSRARVSSNWQRALETARQMRARRQRPQ